MDLSEWADALPSSGFEVFQTPDALEVLDAHTDSKLHLYGVFNGDHPVALFPLFVMDRPVGRTVFSPPPDFSVPRMGPILNPNSPKRSKRERINQTLVEGVLDELDGDASTTLFRVLAPLEYEDPRPFQWRDMTVDPKFTYVVRMEDSTEDVLSNFSRSLRREMTSLADLDVTIEREGLDAALRVYDDVVDRYEDQDETAPMTRGFVRDLVRKLNDRVRVYVAREDDGDRYLGGIIALYSNDLAYYWQGGVRRSYESVSVNNLLHYEIIDDLVNDPSLESVSGYDLVGANTERLCEYKGKFGGELSPYYVVESAGPSMTAAKTAYRWFQGSFGKG
jgi:hypothetical protein